MNNLNVPSPALIALSAVMALCAFLLILNGWIVIAFRQPMEALSLWNWLSPPESWPLVNPKAFDNAMNAAMIVAAGVFCTCLYFAATPPYQSPYGDARWARRHEIARAGLMDQSGVILGKLGGPRSFAPFIRSVRDTYSNTLLVAPPGGGKGVGVVIPTLLTWPGSTVVLDVKGENFDITAKCREEMGDTVFVLSPYEKKRPTHRFNPLAALTEMEDPDEQFTELRRIATFLLTSKGRADEPFIEGARDLFAAAASIAVNSETPTLGHTLRLLAPTTSGSGSSSMAGRFRNLANEATHASAKTTLLQYSAYDPESIATFISVLRSAGLGAWADPAIDKATSANDFDLTKLRDAPQSIYIVIRPNDMEALAPLARLFFQCVIAALQTEQPNKEKPTLPVLLLLDEFKALGKMDALLNAATTIRGYGGRMLIVIQGIPNLEEVYGKPGAKGLMNACQLHAYMSINDPDTKAMVSRSLGSTEVETSHESISRTFGKTGGSRTRSRQLRSSRLITEDGINRLGDDAIILIPQNARPIKAKKVKYYADRSLKKLVVPQSNDGLDVETSHSPSDSVRANMPGRENLFVTDEGYKTSSNFIALIATIREEVSALAK